MSLRLYVEPMDATVVEVSDDGQVRFETGEWTSPTLQERRAILYAAEQAIALLQEVTHLLLEPRR